MLVVEEIGGTAIPLQQSKKAVVNLSTNHILVYGYVKKDVPVKRVVSKHHGTILMAPTVFGEDNIVFSKRRGYYIIRQEYSPEELIRETNVKGHGEFPYQTILRRYEAIDNFQEFEGSQKVLDNKDYLLSSFFPYTFGLEFETSQGYIPEDICYRDGLIPLRDGSIQGIEYSTIILKGNDGLNLLNQQLNTLKEYTWFDKECSLHVHIGDFPLDPKAIYSLYYTCKKLESELEELLPQLTFNTSNYKQNGKDYCKKLPSLRNFNQLYEFFVGRKFYGDFTQSHPNDLRRQAKWRIATRYYSVNFINLLCYNVNKTVEFRFLRPCYNFEKIVLWLYIFNAILHYAEDHSDDIRSSEITLGNVLRYTYPTKVVKKLSKAVAGLRAVRINQEYNSDYIGRETAIEDSIFKGDFGILYK